MTDAPERIWTNCKTPLAKMKSGDWHENPYGTEYIRADLYTALQARLAEVEAERDKLKAVFDTGTTLLHETEAQLEEAEATVATARADALREAAKICEGSSARGEDIFFAILALIDNPEPTK